jgi:hypothetical protein
VEKLRICLWLIQFTFAVEDRVVSQYPAMDVDFLNKGYFVWEAVRREWRGTVEATAQAREKLAAGKGTYYSIPCITCCVHLREQTVEDRASHADPDARTQTRR